MSLYAVLLTVHIIAGFSSLLSSFVAIGSKVWPIAHRWHRWSGKVFFAGMVVVFLTALPMAILRPNLFLFLIAFFSFYLAFAGWRIARNRTGLAQWPDWAAVGVMSVTAVAMLVIGLLSFTRSSSAAIVLFVFAALGALLTAGHASALRGELRGAERIGLHISMMMGATISTLTAFVVVNAAFLPTVLAWLGPTFLLTPVIVMMRVRLRRSPKKILAASPGAAVGLFVMLGAGALSLSSLMTSPAHAAQEQQTSVIVQGAEDASQVRCAAYDKANTEGFPKADQSSASANGEPGDGGVAVCKFDGLEGVWAFAIFVDENGNGKLDTAAFGRPVEPYGFSNGAQGRFGPPPWTKAAVDLQAVDHQVPVTVSK